MLQIQQSTVLLSSDSWNSRARCVAWKQRLQKPPDKTKTNNNQITLIFLSIKFNLIQMNPVNAIFLSEGETQSTFWKLTQRKSLGNINTTTLHLKKFAVSWEQSSTYLATNLHTIQYRNSQRPTL